MSREFDLWNDSHSTKFKQRSRILVKLSFRELRDSKLPVYAFFIIILKNKSKTER